MNKKRAKKNFERKVIKIRISWYFLILLFLASAALAKLTKDLVINKYVSNTKLSVDKTAQKISSRCINSDKKDQCYGDEFFKITKQHDTNYSIKILNRLQEINPQDANGCHFMAHKISQAEVEKDPENWKSILLGVTPSLCTGGFLHGVIEAHMATDQNFSINKDSFQIICDEIYGQHQTFQAWRGCVHNMGHLMLIEHDGSIKNAVEGCSEIQDNMTKYECLSGTFMERVTGENLFAHGIEKTKRGWDEKFTVETEMLCAQYSGDPARACWKVISYLYFAISNHDPKGLYEKCQKAPDRLMRDECFIYGAGNLVNTTRFKPENLHTVCHQFTSDHHLFMPCMNQIIGSLLTSSTNNLNKAFTLCERTYDSFQSQCYRKLFDTLLKIIAPTEAINEACILAGDNAPYEYCNT